MSGTPTEIERLAARARALSLPATIQARQLRLEWPGVATMIVEKTRSDALQVAIWVRTLSYNWSGERSDLNEIFAILIALSLRHDGTSCRLVCAPHPAVSLPGEVYATYLFPVQPNATGYGCDDRGIQRIEELMHSMVRALANLSLLMQHCGWQDTDAPATQWVSIEERRWLNDVIEALGSDIDDCTFNSRRDPNWLFLRSVNGISVFRSELLCSGLRFFCGEDDAPEIDGPTGIIFRHKHLVHCVSKRDLEDSMLLFGKLGEQTSQPFVRAVDNRVLVIGKAVTLVGAVESGAPQVSAERGELLIRHTAESEFLYGDGSMKWAEAISSDRFEELIEAMLRHEPGVRSAWKFGHSNEPDHGCDLLAEWELPPSQNDINPEPTEPTYRLRLVVVQCKSSADRVRTRDIRSVGDALGHHGADGFLLVTRGGVTAHVAEQLNSRRTTREQWISLWTLKDIEDRIRSNPHLLRQFEDVVTISE